MVDRSDLHGKSPKKTLRKAHAVKRSRALRTGVAGVAVASTLAMMLPSVVASALQPTQKDIVNASSATRKMGKGRPDSDELNMQRWGAGVLNKSVQTKRLVDLGRKAIEEEALRAASLRELAKSGESADSHNADSHNAGEVDASGAGKRNDLGLRGSAAGKSALFGAGFNGSDLTGLRVGEHVSAEGASVEHASAEHIASRDNGSVHSRRSAKDTGAKIVQHPQEEQKPETASNSSSQIKDKIQGSAVQQTQSKSVTSAVNVPANTSVTAPASAKPAAATPVPAPAVVPAPAAASTKSVTVPAAPVNVADNHVAQPVAPVVPTAPAKPATPAKPAASASVPAAAPAVKPEVSKPAAENTAVPKPATTNQPEVKPAAKTPVEPQSAQPANSAQPSQQTQTTQPVAKTEPANPQPSQQTQPVAAKPTEVKPDAKPAETKQPETNAESNRKPAQSEHAENKQPAASQPANAENTNSTNTQNASAQPSSTHAENTNTASDASTPKVRKPRSVDGGDSASDGSSVAPANNAPSTPNAAPANNAPTSPAATPAGNAPAPSASTSSAGAESNAGAGTTAKPSAGGNGNAQEQSAGNAQGAQGSAQGTNASVQGEDKSATPSTPTSNAGTQNAGTPSAGTAPNNTATDPNSQVIKPNEKNQTAASQDEANKQVQTDKKPKATYNLKVRYTIGGAANKQLVQPYELTIDKDGFDNLGKDGKYEYIELPKAAGYRPSVYHSGDYQYYVKKGEGDNSKFVIDDGTDADAVRYLRLDKKLITDYAVKERPAVGGNNGAQAPQTSSSQATTNPQSSSSTEPKSEDGIQYYGELNINYAPKTAKYYVRHLLQDLNHKDKFYDAPNLGIGKVITVTHKDGSTERIHVTEITGTVGSNVSAISTYIPGYEPEHNLISSPLSDSDSESDKLILNLRYYRKAYDVTYDTDGGTDVTAQKVYYQQPVPPVTNPTKRGYTFKGWSVVDPSKRIIRSMLMILLSLLLMTSRCRITMCNSALIGKLTILPATA